MYRELTDKEKSYLSEGGRVFLVSDDNEVVILGQDEEHFVPDGEGKSIRYETKQMALETAQMIASLSEDQPMVEGVVVDWR